MCLMEPETFYSEEKVDKMLGRDYERLDGLTALRKINFDETNLLDFGTTKMGTFLITKDNKEVEESKEEPT